MPDQDATNVTELETVSEGEKEALTIEEQAAKIREGEPADDVKAADSEPTDDKKTEEKPPTAEEHKAVMAELKRVRKLNAEKSDEVQGVKERLAKMEGKMEAGSGGGSAKEKLASYDDRALVKLQMQWEDERDTARTGDDAPALSEAKANIEAIRVELHERSTSSAAKASEDKADNEAVLNEAAALVKDAVDAWPDLQNEDSDIYKAAREEFQSKPRVYKQLGVFADMVAVSAAITKNPKLIGTGRDKAVRKEVVGEIQKAAEKAVHAGGGGTGVKPSIDVEAMTSEDIEAAAERIKAGGSLTK